MNVIRRAISSSALQALRPTIAGSVVYAGMTHVVRWLGRTRVRIFAGLGGRWSADQAACTGQQVDWLASDSRVIKGLSSVLTAPLTAWRESGVRRLLERTLPTDLRERIRMLGHTVIVAVMTHTVLLAALGVQVNEIAWGIRAVLVAAGLSALYWPDAFATAWRDRSMPSDNGQRR